MTTEQIAARLAERCAKAEYEKAQKELYSTDAISIEPFETPDFEKETKGLDAIIKKGEKFESMIEKLHETTVSKPLVAGNHIAMTLYMDVTMKGRERMKMTELCLYEVKDGKVISEQFFM